VHYLMLDPDARQRQLLKNFLAAWDKNGSQIEAAQQAFGDLKHFGQVIDAYSRQTMFHAVLFKNGQQAADKSYSVRSLPAGEVLALRGDCAAHREKLEQARPLLEQAVQAEPGLAIGHEAMGYYLYRKEDHSGADKELNKAMELGSTSFVAPYYRGMLLLRGGLVSPEAVQEVIKSFEKVTQINPQFAPAFEGLAQAYSLSPKTQEQAVQAGIQAAKLDPTNRAYPINLIHLLVNDNRDAEARQLAQRLLEKATSPEETQTARELLARITEHEEWGANRKMQMEAAAKMDAEAANPASQNIVASAPAEAHTTVVSSTRKPADSSTLMAADGLVRGIDCSHKPAVTVTLAGGTRPLIFHATDFGDVGVTGDNTLDLDSCDKWKGRRIRIWFLKTEGKPYLGEMTDLVFE
jgi:tetratricopeptide (TPR) repeat protein